MVSTAGPSQGAKAPSGGSAAHEVASVGVIVSIAGPSQGAKAPSGGSEDTKVPSVGATTIPRAYRQIDVFTDTPCLGNPVAVVMDARGLDDETMQRFARWTNLSETTFVLPPSAEAAAQGADYRVRIFTPGGELPFAGHPTLGTCHAWLLSGGQPRQAGTVVQECGVGLVQLRVTGGQLAFAAPALRRRPPEPAELSQVLSALGLQAAQLRAAQWLDNGPKWLGLLLDSPETVLGLAPDHTALKSAGIMVGVAGVETGDNAPLLIARSNREARAFPASVRPGTEATTQSAALQVRAFAAPLDVPEDPVTGSLNASLAQWLIAEGLMPERYVATQGLCLGRHGQVQIERDTQGQVWVGGQSVSCIEGTVLL